MPWVSKGVLGGAFNGTYAGEYISTSAAAGYHFKSRDNQAQGNTLFASAGKIRLNGASAALWEIDRTTGQMSVLGGLLAANGADILRTDAGSRLYSGPAGGTFFIQPGVTGANPLALRSFAGADIYVFGENTATFANKLVVNAGIDLTGEAVSYGTGAGYHFKSRDNQAQGNALFATDNRIRFNGDIADLMVLNRTNGNMAIAGNFYLSASRFVSFVSSVGMKLDMWGGVYTQGIQNNTMYFRTGSSSAGFAWHAGGTHDDGEANPGAGGVNWMRLTSAGLSTAVPIRAQHGIESQGASAELCFNDRTTARRWLWYGQGDVARFYNGAADLFYVTAGGNLDAWVTTRIPDTRSTSPQPNQILGQRRHWDFKNRGDVGLDTSSREWIAMMTVVPWTTYDAAHPQQQLAFCGWGMQFRWATGTTTWAPWVKVTQSIQTQQLHTMTTDPVAAGYAVHEADVWFVG